MSFVWLRYFHSEHHNNDLVYIIIYTRTELSVIDSYTLLNKRERRLLMYGARMLTWCWFRKGWGFSVSPCLVLLHTNFQAWTGLLLITETQAIKRKTVINALVKEAQTAVSSVVLTVPIANLFLLMRTVGGESDPSPDWNTVGTTLKFLSLLWLGWWAKDNNAQFGSNLADIQGYQPWSVLAICHACFRAPDDGRDYFCFLLTTVMNLVFFWKLRPRNPPRAISCVEIIYHNYKCSVLQ